MTSAGGLSRRIIRSMVSLALATTLLTVLGSYAFYTLWLILSPANFPGANSESLFPTPPEWGWMALTALAALGLAVVSALGLARQILVPLNSVAESLRQVALGDLTVRASTDDQSLGEVAHLVRDFNAMAERLDRMERERQFWSAAIAHELRTPVTVLRGRLQGLTEGVFEPDPALFRSLLTQVEGLGRLIEDLRLVGLAENGRLDLYWEQTDLSAEIAAVVQAFEPSLIEAGFSLSCQLDNRPVLCDPVRIRQALLALLENARHHAIPGPVRILVRVEPERCHLVVEDSGPGVPEAEITQIFVAFQRGQSHGRGNGLGLAVVQAIAHAHGGDVSCGPSPLGGSGFDLCWPI